MDLEFSLKKEREKREINKQIDKIGKIKASIHSFIHFGIGIKNGKLK